MKKFLIAFLIVAIPLGVGGGILYDHLHNKPSESDEKPFVEAKKLPSQETKEYKDPAGFSFELPDDVQASASSSLDNFTYADLALTSKVATGSITFKVTDTKLISMDAWLRSREASLGAIKDVKLGELPSKEIKQKNTITTGAIDQKILFELRVLPEKKQDYWKQVYKTILDTFSFVNPQASETSSSGGFESDVVYEGEEIIE